MYSKISHFSRCCPWTFFNVGFQAFSQIQFVFATMLLEHTYITFSFGKESIYIIYITSYWRYNKMCAQSFFFQVKTTVMVGVRKESYL